MVSLFTLLARGAFAGGVSLIAACAASSQQTSYRQALAESRPLAVPELEAEAFAGKAVLIRRDLVAAVLARNPDIEAARAGWRRALARYPQERTIEDPVVTYRVAPLSVAGDAPF